MLVLPPSTLLERRPDIAATQRRVAAAYPQIGVADVAYFPDLVLSANAGFRGAGLARLVSAPNLWRSLGTSLAQAVLDGGQRPSGGLMPGHLSMVAANSGSADRQRPHRIIASVMHTTGIAASPQPASPTL